MSINCANPQNQYIEYCDYIKQKYGLVPKPYFTNEALKSKTIGIFRTKEGLVIYHIKEDTWIMLCDSKWCFRQKVPFSAHSSINLVYCNYLEHIKLHNLIFMNCSPAEETQRGIGGIINYLIPEINDWYFFK